MKRTKLLEQSILDGDPAAYERLFELYAHDLLRLGYSILVNVEETEDVVQEVLFSFVESVKSGHFRGGNGTVRAYLHKSIRNKCIDCLRKQKHFYHSIDHESAFSVQDLIEPSLQPSEALDETRMLRRIEEGIKKLPSIQRAVIVMRVFDDLPYSAIAEELNISVDYVKNLLARARKQLRSEIDSAVKG